MLDNSNKKKKKILVIFEGSDLSGKTTTLERLKSRILVEKFPVRNIDIIGNNLTFKFPVYDSVLGKHILDHLKNFKPDIDEYYNIDYLSVLGLNYSKDILETRKLVMRKIIEFSSMQCINKSYNIDNLLNKFVNNDIVLCDRGFLSQYVYDIAWTMFDKIGPNYYNNGYEEAFSEFALANASMVKKAILERFEVRFGESYDLHVLTEVFEGNDVIIKHFVDKSKNIDRRIDAYDTMVPYKNSVNSNFNRIVNKPDECKLDEAERKLLEDEQNNMVYSTNSVTQTYLDFIDPDEFESKEKHLSELDSQYGETEKDIVQNNMSEKILNDICKVLENNA